MSATQKMIDFQISQKEVLINKTTYIRNIRKSSCTFACELVKDFSDELILLNSSNRINLQLLEVTTSNRHLY